MGWSQIFLKIEFQGAGVLEGESEFAGFEKQIVLLDFDWSMKVKQDIPQKNAPPLRMMDMDPLKITKRFDAASVKLLNCLKSRDPIVKARITATHRVGEGDTPRQAFVLEVEKARLESIDLDMNESGKSVILQEDISIRYAKVKIEYYPLQADGRYSTRPKIYTSKVRDNLDMQES